VPGHAGSGPQPGDYTAISVADDGCGMSAQVRDHAMEAFFTTRDVGEGTGLGLSVSHGIVQGHGGHIEIESEEGVGTKVTVLIPVADGADGEEAATSPEEPRDISAVRVMLVDDDPAVASLGMAMLRRIGCPGTSFTDAREAEEALERTPDGFDLLVTDHSMPGMTGTQLAARARELNPALAVVVVSGYHLGAEPGAAPDFTYLGKPFTKAEFQAAVTAALESAPAAGPVPDAAPSA